jgi:parallel beta-helix repeat protein
MDDTSYGRMAGRRVAVNVSPRFLRAVLASIGLTTVLLLLPGAARAATTLYVDQAHDNCSNAGPGTASQPFCSIGAAAARTTAGTTVLVSSGTYVEQVSVRSGAAGNPVTFRAAPGATPVVRGGNYAWYVSAKSWVTIEGFAVTDTANDGFHVSSGSHHINVLRNHVYETGEPISGMTGKAIAVTDSSDVRVEGNNVERISTYGIYLVTSTRVDIVGNTASRNAKRFDRSASGIRLYDSDANTIVSNVTHHNEDSGIELVTNSDGNTIAGNVAYQDGDHGIDLVNSRNNRIVANSVYRSVTSGINVEGGSTGTTLANNIAVDNGIDSPRARGNLRVDSASTSATTLDYDLVHQSVQGQQNFNWNGSGYATLAQFRAVAGEEDHGIEADPRWVSPSTADFGLDLGSPAIDSADSGAAGQQAADAAGNPRVDVPAVPDTGAGPRTYDDRGAYERQMRDTPPVAALTVSPASGDVNLIVTADASASTDTDGTSPIASYRFDFGDGSPVVGPQASATANHTYTETGTYTVTVTVTDTAGLSDTETHQVVVGGDPPVARLAVTPPAGMEPLRIEADASASSGGATPITGYRFDFGDGSPPVGPQPEAVASHTYAEAGTYTVTVTVIDAAGLTGTATAQVVVRGNAVGNPGFEADLSGWNVSGSGAGVTLERAPGGHGGDHAARLVNTGGGAATCALNDAPDWVQSTSAGTYTGSLWVRGDTPGAVLKLRFREWIGPTLAATSVNEITLTTSWRQVTLNHVAQSPGSRLDMNAYVLGAPPGTCFRADDARIILATAADRPPVAALTVTPSTGGQVQADASASSDDDGVSPIASYRFDFGDGSVDVGPQPGAIAQHTYAAAGTYTVTVTVRDTAGLSATAEAQVVVAGNLIGNPGFETGIGGWNSSGSGAGVTLERSTVSHSGGHGVTLTNTAGTAATCTLNDSPDWVRPTGAGSYRGSLWVRGGAPGATLKLRFREWSGSTLAGTSVSQVALSDSWQQVSTTYTVQAPGSSLDFSAYVTGAGPGTCFHADDAAIVRE